MALTFKALYHLNLERGSFLNFLAKYIDVPLNGLAEWDIEPVL